jgi:CheY-like chemotaxis protein
METPEPLAVLVEDNLMFAMMVEPALKRLGYRVRTLTAAAGAAEKIASGSPALVLVNLTTTRYSGADLVRELRSTPGMEATPIIGYAGHVEREFFQAGKEAGADLVVPNSAIRASLAEVINKASRR